MSRSRLPGQDGWADEGPLIRFDLSEARRVSAAMNALPLAALASGQIVSLTKLEMHEEHELRTDVFDNLVAGCSGPREASGSRRDPCWVRVRGGSFRDSYAALRLKTRCGIPCSLSVMQSGKYVAGMVILPS